MADPITAEQVARAIEVARADEGGISDALGGWQWDKRAPDYVRVAWGKPSLPDFIAALTRWHAELVAAETPRKAPDDTAPERLRDRREALGLSRRGMAVIAQRHETGDVHWEPEDIRICEIPANPPHRASGRATYAAALIAAEAERARPAIDPLAYTDSPAWDEPPVRKPAPEVVDVPQPDHLAYADSPVWDDGPLPTPTPERPAPRFKEGDWVRHRESAGAWQVASFFEDSRGYVYCWNSHHSGFPEDVIVAAEVPGEPVPASPPAPEVVDVPQPIVKRCACPDIHDAVEAEWQSGEPYLTVTHTTVPLALLRAMLEAIDAQQGGAS